MAQSPAFWFVYDLTSDEWRPNTLQAIIIKTYTAYTATKTQRM